jgi:hypothetical protein
MSEEQGQGFVIRDRRGRTSEEESPTNTSARVGTPSSADSGAERAHRHVDEPHVPLSFSSFVISLGSSALMFMGEQLDPQEPAPPVNLPQAKEMIDLLSMLEEKTKGNLTTDEQTVMRDMLYALRMKYVSLAPRTPSGSSI